MIPTTAHSAVLKIHIASEALPITGLKGPSVRERREDKASQLWPEMAKIPSSFAEVEVKYWFKETA